MVELTHDERLRESACHLQIPARVIEVVRRLAGGVPYHRRPGDAAPERCSCAAAQGRSARGRHGMSGAAALPLRHGSGVRVRRSLIPGLQIVDTTCIDKEE